MVVALVATFGLLILGGILFWMNPQIQDLEDELPNEPFPITNVEGVEEGVHLETGFTYDEGLQVVIANCTPCHSSKLVIQNRATRDGWESMIQWMQETQNLWDLGTNHEIILNYLARNYAPESKGRRAYLENIEWYELED